MPAVMPYAVCVCCEMPATHWDGDGLTPYCDDCDDACPDEYTGIG